MIANRGSASAGDGSDVPPAPEAEDGSVTDSTVLDR